MTGQSPGGTRRRAKVFYANLLVAAAGALGTWGFMVYAGEPDTWWWWLGFLAFAAWAAIPFGVVAVASHRFRNAAAALELLLLASLLLTISAMCLLYDAFVARPDAQSGIAFLPVWQMIGLAPFLLGSRFLHGRRAGA